jgi:hypothetical protein
MNKLKYFLFFFLASLICTTTINAQAGNTTSRQAVQKDENELNFEEQLNEVLLDSLRLLMDNYNENCLTITIAYDGYESSSDESLYYDSLGTICGYHVTWNMEGTSGEEFYWFDKGKLSYVYEETYGQEEEPDVVFIDGNEEPGKILKYNPDIASIEQRISKLMTDKPDNVTEDETSVTIYIEEIKNYGQDFTETTKINFDKALQSVLF